MQALELQDTSRRFSVGAALLMSFLLLYLVPKILGEVGEDYAELSALQDESCEDGRPALRSAQALFRWQGRFPLWGGRHTQAQVQALHILVSRRCDQEPAHDELMERMELSQSLLLALQGHSREYPYQSGRPSSFRGLRDRVEAALFRWGYPGRVLSLSEKLDDKSVTENRLRAHQALADLPSMIAAGEAPTDWWRGRQGRLLCLSGDIEAGLATLRDYGDEALLATLREAGHTDDPQYFSAVAECLLLGKRYQELIDACQVEASRLKELEEGERRYAPVDYYRAMAAVDQGNADEAEALLQLSKEHKTNTIRELVWASLSRWDALHVDEKPFEKPLFPEPTVRLPSEHFLSYGVPFSGATNVNERLILRLAKELAAAQSARASEIHRRASHYYLVLAVNLAARWDPEADQYFEKSMTLAPEWELPAALQKNFAFAHGQWQEEQAKQISPSLAKVIKLGPKHHFTGSWRGGGVSNYHELGDLLASSLTVAQKMDVLRQSVGTASSAENLWRLTNLVVVGQFYDRDVSQWQEHLTRLRNLLGMLAQGH